MKKKSYYNSLSNEKIFKPWIIINSKSSFTRDISLRGAPLFFKIEGPKHVARFEGFIWVLAEKFENSLRKQQRKVINALFPAGKTSKVSVITLIFDSTEFLYLQ